MCVLSLSFVSDCWEHFSVFWCFTAQRIRSMMRIMMSGSLVRNSLSVSACKNVNSCLLHWGENTERPWKIKWFHFSTHRATLQRVHERLSDLMLPYQCYLTDAAADICFSRVALVSWRKTAGVRQQRDDVRPGGHRPHMTLRPFDLSTEELLQERLHNRYTYTLSPRPHTNPHTQAECAAL